MQAIKGYEIKQFWPFNPVDKKTTARVVTPDGGELLVAKGAPQVPLRTTSAPDHLILLTQHFVWHSRAACHSVLQMNAVSGCVSMLFILFTADCLSTFCSWAPPWIVDRF